MSKSTHIKRFAVPTAIIAFALLVFVLLFISRPKVEATPITEKTWGVAVISAKLEKLTPRIKLFGKVESGQLAHIKAAVAADVISVNIKEGHHVNKGDLLLQLDDSELVLVVKQRQAEISELDAEIINEEHQFETDKNTLAQETKLLNFATKEYQRAQSLQRDKLATQSLIDSAQQNVVREELVVGQQKLKVNRFKTTIKRLQAKRTKLIALKELALISVRKTKLRAPFSGKIVGVTAVVGDRTQIGQPMLDMYSDASIEIRAHVPNTYASRFQLAQINNQTIVGNLVASNDVELQFDRLSVGYANSGGIIDAFFVPVKPVDQLSLGLAVELDIALPEMDNVVAIPREAIYGFDLIYLYDNGRMRSINIDRVGEYSLNLPTNSSTRPLSNNKSRQILIRSKEVKPEDKIIVTQIPNAINGLRVKIIE